MRKILLVAAALAVPMSASSQSIGIAARAGSLGLGGEAAVGFGSIVLRGGFGVIPIEFNRTYSDIDYSLKPTSPIMNIGVDFYPGGGGLRFGAGMMLLSEPTVLDGEFDGTVRIGNNTYTDSEVLALHGELDHGGAAPYVLVGFGRHTATGFGIFLDLGAGFLKEAAFTLDATGAVTQSDQFRADLEVERADAEQKAKDYLKIFPIASIGIRFGLGN
ncbi:MAG TPA: hypothetical protein VK928_01525 [Longimicrobiales bacterium]|nr:hypothetical protein [Longimicrobiales bacterium]